MQSICGLMYLASSSMEVLQTGLLFYLDLYTSTGST